MKEHCKWKSCTAVTSNNTRPNSQNLREPCCCCYARKVGRQCEPLQLRQSYYLLIPHRCLLPWQHLLDAELADGLLNRRAFGQHISGQISELPVSELPGVVKFSLVFSGKISTEPQHGVTTTQCDQSLINTKITSSAAAIV